MYRTPNLKSKVKRREGFPGLKKPPRQVCISVVPSRLKRPASRGQTVLSGGPWIKKKKNIEGEKLTRLADAGAEGQGKARTGKPDREEGEEFLKVTFALQHCEEVRRLVGKVGRASKKLERAETSARSTSIRSSERASERGWATKLGCQSSESRAEKGRPLPPLCQAPLQGGPPCLSPHSIITKPQQRPPPATQRPHLQSISLSAATRPAIREKIHRPSSPGIDISSFWGSIVGRLSRIVWGSCMLAD